MTAPTVAVLVPAGELDTWRAAAFEFVRSWWARHFPHLPLEVGTSSGSTWNKGEAIADAARRTSADVLVLADADSVLADPRHMSAAIGAVAAGAPWAIPHRRVYRLRADESARLHGNPTDRPRLGHLARAAYEGVPGGGLVVVDRSAFELVRGIDPRFAGWGGEDVAFGWALETLAGRAIRCDGQLVHLWHPHPAPTLRGSPESEALVARYRMARGLPYRMAALVAGEEWTPREQLATAVRFRLMGRRRLARLANGELVRFDRAGFLTTTDPDLADLVRQLGDAQELPR